MISNIQTHLKSTLLIPFFEIKSIGSNANLRKNYLSLFLFRARSPSIFRSLSIFIYTLFTYKPWDAKAAIGNHPPRWNPNSATFQDWGIRCHLFQRQGPYTKKHLDVIRGYPWKPNKNPLGIKPIVNNGISINYLSLNCFFLRISFWTINSKEVMALKFSCCEVWKVGV